MMPILLYTKTEKNAVMLLGTKNYVPYNYVYAFVLSSGEKYRIIFSKDTS